MHIYFKYTLWQKANKDEGANILRERMLRYRFRTPKLLGILTEPPDFKQPLGISVAEVLPAQECRPLILGTCLKPKQTLYNLF